jgi:hypothetical protein
LSDLRARASALGGEDSRRERVELLLAQAEMYRANADRCETAAEQILDAPAVSIGVHIIPEETA